ncbi:MAG: hypothetical protein IT585_00690 [candidate division Zixibacteria bacterium]|nr:hypothetical protein [candidate division Zixibacteria bacterium]
MFIDDTEIQGDNLNALFADLNDAALFEPNVCAKWSIKDMVAQTGTPAYPFP